MGPLGPPPRFYIKNLGDLFYIMLTLNICDLLDELFPNNGWYNEYALAQKRVAQWCLENDAYHYARDRESFSRAEAFRLAQEAGCSIVVLEDLS